MSPKTQIEKLENKLRQHQREQFDVAWKLFTTEVRTPQRNRWAGYLLDVFVATGWFPPYEGANPYHRSYKDDEDRLSLQATLSQACKAFFVGKRLPSDEEVMNTICSAWAEWHAQEKALQTK